MHYTESEFILYRIKKILRAVPDQNWQSAINSLAHGKGLNRKMV